MVGFVCRVALVALCLAPLAAAAPAAGTDQRQNAPGQFDFYVLSLSWSPSFCAAAAERKAGAAARAGGPECGARRYGFVVHGLWPQYDNGFPQYCQIPAPRLDRGMVAAMLDLMPAPRLVFNEWDRHGTCSGLSARGYFDAVRKARAAVKIPPEYTAPTAPLAVSPAAVADAFIAANPGLTAMQIAIGCNDNRLTEVRICLAKDLTKDVQFHDCAEVAKRSCRRDRLTMPPLRGGADAS